MAQWCELVCLLVAIKNSLKRTEVLMNFDFYTFLVLQYEMYLAVGRCYWMMSYCARFMHFTSGV